MSGENTEGRSRDLTSGPLLKPLVFLSLPIVASQLMQVAYNLADTFWVGRLGQDAVTALSLSLPFVFLMVSLGGGLTVAGTVLVSQNTGAGNTREVGHVAGQTIAFVSLVAIVLAALGFLLAPVLLPFIGATPGTEINRLAVEYTRTIFVGVIFMFGFFIFQALLRGYGDTMTPMYLMAGSVVLNIVLDPFLILGFQGNPIFEWLQILPIGVDFLALQADLFAATEFTGLGVQGAAIATVFSRGVVAVIGLWLLFSGRLGISIQFSDLLLERESVTKIIEIGVPTAAEQGANSLAYTAMTALVALVSPAAVAAYGIGNRINTLVFLPAMGLAQGTETAVGQNLGAGETDRAKRSVYLSGAIVVVGFTVVSLLAFVFAESIVSVFISGEGAADVVRMGTDYFKIIGPTYVFMGLFQVINGGFRGAGSTRTAMVFSMISQWGLRIPPTYILITVFSFGATGAWYGVAISHVGAALLAILWYLRGTWATSVIEDDGEPAEESLEAAVDD